MLDILEKKLTESPTTIKGLTTAEAEKRLSTDGENRLAKKKKTSAGENFRRTVPRHHGDDTSCVGGDIRSTWAIC